MSFLPLLNYDPESGLAAAKVVATPESDISLALGLVLACFPLPAPDKHLIVHSMFGEAETRAYPSIRCS